MNLRQAFLAYLRENEFSPGDKLEGEVALAARFGVSRAAMREVIGHFHHLGILERTKNRGTFLKAIDPAELEETLSVCFQLSGYGFEELMEARLALESAVLPLAVKRLSPVMIQRMRALLEETERVADSPEEADRLDRDFHLLLLEACQSPVLRLFSSVIFLLFRKEHRGRYRNPPAVRKSLKSHRAILAAMTAGDTERACRLLAEHIRPA